MSILLLRTVLTVFLTGPYLIFLYSRVRLNHGGGHKFWVNFDHFDQNIISLEVSWIYYSDYMNPNTYCLWNCNNNLYINDVTVYSMNMRKGHGHGPLGLGHHGLQRKLQHHNSE